MDARTKAVKAHRKRIRDHGMKRMEVTIRDGDAPLMRRLAAELRRNDENATRLRAVVSAAMKEQRGPTLAEMLYDPAIAGPEFDAVFEEIERFRHDPVMLKIRDIDL